MTKSALMTLAGAVVLTTACTLGPSWEKPQMEVPAVFRGATVGENCMADLPWQAVLKDKNLQALLNDVFTSNRSLEALSHNVEAARQYVTMTASPLFPSLGYTGSASNGVNTSGGAIVDTGSSTVKNGMAGVSASWEIDLWGKTRRAVESADASAMEVEEELNNLRISLMRQVATGYLQLIMLDEQLRITRNSVESYSDTLKLFNDQLKEGVVDRLQVASAQAALAAAQAEAPALEMQIAALENTLSMLAGRAPGHIARSGSLKSYMNASTVAAGIPADLLARRPDIRAKEQALRAANAEVGVAIASYFPSISLTGAGGYAFPGLEREVDGWGIGANLTGPLFQAGRLTANEAAKKEAFLAAKADYEQAVLSALSEVASTLTQRSKLRDVIAKQEEAVAAYEQTVTLAKQRYKEGYSAYFEVLDNQLRLFPAQKQLANYRYQYAACIPTLYTQLGGGWKK